MLVFRPGTQLKIFMVNTPQGPKPRFFKGSDRLQKDKRNSLGLQAAVVSTVADTLFLVSKGETTRYAWMMSISRALLTFEVKVRHDVPL